MPTSMREREKDNVFLILMEVDRMPINFVRNPLLNPHESKAQSLYSPFVFEDPHTHTFKLIYTHAEGERVGNNNKCMGERRGGRWVLFKM